MDSYRVINSEKVKDDLIKHTVMDGDVASEVKYLSVRGGVSYPSEDGPGGFVVLGQEADTKYDEGRLVLLDEFLYSGFSIDQFWNRITDAVVLMLCSPIYLNFSEESKYQAFLDYLSRKKLKIDFEDAPWAEDFYTGISTANDWVRREYLELFKSKTREELRSIGKEDLKVSPEKRYPLSNALRHCVSGFRKYPCQKPFSFTTFYGGKGGESSWMV